MRATLNVRLGHLDRQIDQVLVLLGRLPESVRSAPPSPERWSPVQTVQHLVLVHEGAATILARATAPVGEPHHPSWWRPAVMRFVLRAGIRIRAPTPRVLPAGMVPVAVLAERWKAAQAALRGTLEAKGARWGNSGVFRHPLAGWLDPAQTLDFLSDHIDHHRGQAGEG